MPELNPRRLIWLIAAAGVLLVALLLFLFRRHTSDPVRQALGEFAAAKYLEMGVPPGAIIRVNSDSREFRMMQRALRDGRAKLSKSYRDELIRARTNLFNRAFLVRGDGSRAELTWNFHLYSEQSDGGEDVQEGGDVILKVPGSPEPIIVYEVPVQFEQALKDAAFAEPAPSGP